MRNSFGSREEKVGLDFMDKSRFLGKLRECILSFHFPLLCPYWKEIERERERERICSLTFP